MSRVDDATLAGWLIERGNLPEEGGFHSQEGLFFRRLDDGRVRVSVVAYDQQPNHAPPIHRLVFTTVLTPYVWASIAASAGYRDETAAVWDEALRYHMGAVGNPDPTDPEINEGAPV